MRIIIELNPDSADLPNAIARINKLRKLDAVQLIENEIIENEIIENEIIENEIIENEIIENEIIENEIIENEIIEIKEHTGAAPICPELPKDDKKKSNKPNAMRRKGRK